MCAFISYLNIFNKIMNDSITKESYLEFAERVARSNGKLIIEEQKKLKGFVKKDKYFNEIVEDQIVNNTNSLIKTEFPDHTFFNVTKKLNAESYEWIVDPIDGAFGYSRGLWGSVTSVALTLDGVSICSVVFDPWHDKLYTALQGKGAYLNGEKISVNNQMIEKQTFINTEWWPMATYDVKQVIHNLSKEKMIYSLHIGSVIQSGCLVAEGVFSASVFGGLVHGKNHEAAAVKLIVEEAGGVFTDLKGNKVGFIGDIHGFIISNPKINKELVEVFASLFK